eukprot:s176_g43.t1
MYARMQCALEASNRYQSFRNRLCVDRGHGFSSLTYKIVKASPTPPLFEEPFETSGMATLVRSAKGCEALRLDDDIPFVVGKTASLGGFDIRLTSREGSKVFFQSDSSHLPCRALLVQSGVAMTTQEIQGAFNSFWNGFWNRDTVDETTDPACWTSFQEELDRSALPQLPEIQVDLNDPAQWLAAIKSLKNRNAHGAYGWRYEELKKLPPSCVQDLAAILARGAQYGLSAPLMMAKTTLLAKIPQPESLHHIRPITVLVALYRLLGKAFVAAIPQTLGCSAIKACNRVTVYTDGGALFPADPCARVSSWAVVVDTSEASIPDIQLMASYLGDSKLCPLFEVLGAGLVCGHQSSSRGELLAYLRALEAAASLGDCVELALVTDASYVCFVDWAIRNQIAGFPSHECRNRDLVCEVRSKWISRMKVHKIKSHRSLSEAKNWHDLWALYGNHCADFAASVSLRQIPQQFLDMFRDISLFHVAEAKRLLTVFKYLVDLNVGDDPRPDGLMPTKAMGLDAMRFLQAFSPVGYLPCFQFDQVDLDCLHGILQGANFASSVLKWLAALQWPPDMDEGYDRPDDWGYLLARIDVQFRFVFKSISAYQGWWAEATGKVFGIQFPRGVDAASFIPRGENGQFQAAVGVPHVGLIVRGAWSSTRSQAELAASHSALVELQRIAKAKGQVPVTISGAIPRPSAVGRAALPHAVRPGLVSVAPGICPVTPLNGRAKICKYFMKGWCYDGLNCPMVHGPTPKAAPTPKVNSIASLANHPAVLKVGRLAGSFTPPVQNSVTAPVKSLLKTELCGYFQNLGVAIEFHCSTGWKGWCYEGQKCPKAHGEEELGQPQALTKKRGRDGEDVGLTAPVKRLKSSNEDTAEYEEWRDERLDLGVDPEGLNAQSLELWYAQICLICSTPISGLSNWPIHANGSKHMSRYLALGGAKLKPTMHRPDPQLQDGGSSDKVCMYVQKQLGLAGVHPHGDDDIDVAKPGMAEFLSVAGFDGGMVLSIGEQESMTLQRGRLGPICKGEDKH